MDELAFQDYYPDELSHCYGCGKNNEKGHQIKTYWDGDTTVTRFIPEPHHTAMPGYVYGGLIASLVDCHGTGSASAAAYKAEGRELGTEPALRFVTASLQVDFVAPTPLKELTLRGKIVEVKGRKVIVNVEVIVDDKVCAKGRVVAVKMPDNFLSKD